MAVLRTIRKVWRSRPTIEGAGVHLKRAFREPGGAPPRPLPAPRRFSARTTPRNTFPDSPGTRTAGSRRSTYVLEGDVEHGDSMGNRGRHHRGATSSG